MHRILWADDEIEQLQAHILFLKSKGYDVITVTNGDDALAQIAAMPFDLVLLDESMPGKDGLTTLNEIKDSHPQTPVIMITKNEEESLMEEAIGKRIDDYLTKPVNPSQILLAAKKILDKKSIIVEKRSQKYVSEISNLSISLMNMQTPQDWIDQSLKISRMDIELDATSDEDYRQILYDQRKESNKEFGKYLEKSYPQWVQQEKNERPTLSTDLIEKYVVPRLKTGEKSVFIVIDCMRLDQWLAMEHFFYEGFNIEKDYFYSVLPTATPFSRNAIFSGLFPSDIERLYPQYWSLKESEESLNRFEKELLELQLKRKRVPENKDIRYLKIMNNNEAANLEKNISSYLEADLLAIVINFVDILAHSRSDLPILKEIAPNEAAYRTLTRSWFEHSPFMSIFRSIAESGTQTFVTSDHGSVRGLHASKVVGDREASTNMRYKYGRSLRVDKKHAAIIKEAADWKLPAMGINSDYIIAKEDYYFVYPNNYSKFVNQYRDSFQHGGLSMEEVILPMITLKSKL